MAKMNAFHTKLSTLLFSSILLLSLNACNESSVNPSIDIDCADGAQLVFQEAEGLITIETENVILGDGWELRNSIAGFTGVGYLEWRGGNQFNNPGEGLLTYKIQIENPGSYAIIIRSYIAVGNDHTEHNDVWVRMPDADDFYGYKNNGNSIVYPKGSGKTPEPNGAGKDGWFKSYMSELNTWSLQTRTSDHDAHTIFATFNSPGVYTLELSGRSQGFAIDRITLFDPEFFTLSEAANTAKSESTSTCQ